jgi:hypothetical protein
MQVIDNLKKEQKKIKDFSFAGKCSYIWDYYKVPIIASVIVILFAVLLIKDVVLNSRPTYLYTCILNSNYTYETDTTIPIEYTNYAAIDTEAQILTFDYSMHIDPEGFDQSAIGYQQKLLALLSSNEVDVIIGNEEIIENYAKVGAYTNLQELLPDDLAQELEEKGYTYYTYRNEDGQTVPVGINMETCTRFHEDGELGTYAEGDNPIFTIILDSKQSAHALEFLRFLISKD